tara:strand:+ start:4435 stop:4950 length:516 start_codon:yes stop_codon:yes gene_type:complete
MKLKCILLGDCKTGKTHLLSHFRKTIDERYMYIPTIGVDFFRYEGAHIWDTSGDPRFSSIMRSFIWSSNLSLLFFNDEESLHNLKNHYDMVLNMKKPCHKTVVVSCARDMAVEVEGLYFSHMYKLDFHSLDIYNKEKCKEFLEHILERYGLEDNDKKDAVEKPRHCWWNLW